MWVKKFKHTILDEAIYNSAINLSKVSKMEIKHDTKKEEDTQNLTSMMKDGIVI